MAEPLLSLMTPGTMKHVVPWKTRSDFLTVYQDLYSDDVKSQEAALGRILAWKSRAGNKLSVAIESSASLMQVRVQHLQAEKDGTLRQIEPQLCSSYSLALIRFVNHMTEKAQTKASAQPVHLVAREFGIPEWIVRLRHDATHSALPCLDALASGCKWALDYLQHNFWEQQRVSSLSKTGSEDTGGDSSGTSAAKNEKSPNTAEIRRAFYEFQKIRYQTSEAGSESNAKGDLTAILVKLQKVMSQNKMKFIKCVLEDGILIGTEEQLQAFDIDPEDLQKTWPPTIPEEIALFWRPLLKIIGHAGVLPLLLHTAMFSVTSEDGLRNYQLVAWIAFILANTTSPRGRRKRHRKQDCFIKQNQPVPTATLFSACVQTLNTLTAHLLRHLLDQDNVGPEVYAKVMQQLQVVPFSAQQTEDSELTDEQTGAADTSSSSSDSDSEYTLQGSKRTHVNAVGGKRNQISTSTVENIKKIIEHRHISWDVCTDLVDWSAVPLGVLPGEVASGAGDSGSDDDNPADLSVSGRPAKQGRRRRRRERGDRGKDDDDDEEEDEDDESDDPDQQTSSKQSRLIVTDELLI